MLLESVSRIRRRSICKTVRGILQMSHIIHERNNPFSTFALRDKRLCKSGRGVISSATFLMGVAAVVLGLMFALSTPSFATPGDYIKRDGTEDIEVTIGSISVGGTISEGRAFGSAGLRAEHTGMGKIEITNRLIGTRYVHADHEGTGNIKVTNHRGIYRWWGLHDSPDFTVGIRADHTGTGNIEITHKRDRISRVIEEVDIGILAEHAGTGDIIVTNEGSITTDHLIWTDPYSGQRSGRGIRAEHTGTGNIKVTNEGSIYGKDIGVKATHTGSGFIAVDVLGGVSGETGIFIERSGTSVANTDNATYDVNLDIKGEVSGYEKGIVVNQNRAGNVVFKIHDEGGVRAPGIAPRGSYNGLVGYYGIEATHTSTGEIRIDLSGTISGGDGAGPISMASAGTKTLVLRPGFELKSKQSRVEVISAGTGDGILELNQDDDPLVDGATPASASLNFGALDFQGFNEFAKKGGNAWKISGAASDDEMFDTATIWEGTLRFTDGVTFKMAPAATGADPNYFKIANNAVLEIVGGNNVLEGNLDNLGEIVFKQDAGQNVVSALTVGNDGRGGDYKGGGKVVFDAGSSGWRADKLKIEGSKDTADLTQVSIKGVDSNFDSRENEYLPMVVEVEGEVAVTSIWGLADVDIHQYYLDASYDFNEEEDRITMHRWKFRRGVELSTLSRTSLSLEEGLTAEVDLEEEVTLDSDEENPELGLRASVHGQSGGVWGRQQNLRTSTGPSLIASRGSRKEYHRVHFGYDTPAMGFMGGDMVVRTSVSSGLSVSDAFSSSNRSRINMESNAAALTALWQSPSGFYAGGGTRYVRSSSNISADGFAMARDNNGVGVGASAKAGYRFAVPLAGMDFSVAPQVQLLWSRVDFDDFVGLNGEVASLEDGGLMTGRLGLSWNGDWQDVASSGRIYGKMNLHNALDGETTVSVSGIPLSRERSDLSIDGNLGLSYEWGEGYEVHGEVSALRNDDAEEIRADFGMSIDF